ncbi:MAG: threonine synthase [Bacteroidota bacterium]|nr:threonine synthase [Bacteroidota bacterium]
MQLYSTNHQSPNVNLREALFKGLPDDNGLYMPTHIPQLPLSFFENIEKLSFQEIAFMVTKALIGDEVPEGDIRSIVESTLTFDAPLVKVSENIFSLELFHGPTFAFKDFGARFMAALMSYYLSKSKEEVNILVATSGDTGGAVAAGFYNMPGIKVTILYPKGKVSDIQEKQLTTLKGNITALEIEGTFDDCQKLVKQAFLDQELNKKVNLTSANSINISRLIPQSFYYFYAYSKLKEQGNELVFSTPSGNFGNICGGLIAKRMGLPVNKFIASTNINDIFPQYLFSGIFSPRPSQRTISNAMDVGNPSNFARIMDLYGKELLEVKKDLEGMAFTDEETSEVIKLVYEKHNYMLDPHGAVGYLGLKKYLGDKKNLTGVFLGTAHPAKFLDVLDKDLASKVVIPQNLQIILKKEKSAVTIKAEFEDLKNFLINNG